MRKKKLTCPLCKKKVVVNIEFKDKVLAYCPNCERQYTLSK